MSFRLASVLNTGAVRQWEGVGNLLKWGTFRNEGVKDRRAAAFSFHEHLF